MSYKLILDRILSFFFPDACIFCGRILGHVKNGICICSHCAKQQVFLDEGHTCRLCGAPLPHTERLCQTCQTHRHAFDRAISCMSYEKDARTAILRFKFGNRPDLCRSFACMLSRRVRPLHGATPFDVILYPPLSKSAYRERGYNQSELLAKRLAKELGLPLMQDAFRKVKETPKQSTLNYGRRIANVLHAFALEKPSDAFRGKRILLIDDVLTTGATADALAKLLKRAGAAYVLVATIASTKQEPKEPVSKDEVDAITF